MLKKLMIDLFILSLQTFFLNLLNHPKIQKILKTITYRSTPKNKPIRSEQIDLWKSILQLFDDHWLVQVCMHFTQNEYFQFYWLKLYHFAYVLNLNFVFNSPKIIMTEMIKIQISKSLTEFCTMNINLSHFVSVKI